MSYGNGMFRSSDGGQTFAPVSASPPGLKQGEFASDGTFYGVDGETKAVWKYAGGKWTDLSGSPGLRSERYMSITVQADAKRIFLFDGGGDPHVSVDGGESWKRLKRHAVAGPKDPPWLGDCQQESLLRHRRCAFRSGGEEPAVGRHRQRASIMPMCRTM